MSGQIGLLFSLPFLDVDAVDYFSVTPNCQEHVVWLAFALCIVQALLTLDMEELNEGRHGTKTLNTALIIQDGLVCTDVGQRDVDDLVKQLLVQLR